MIDGWGNSCEIVLRWISLDLMDDKSILVQVMAWCRQATSHYLSHCWSIFFLPYGLTWPQCINSLRSTDPFIHQWTGSSLVQVGPRHRTLQTWWHPDKETFFTLLALCVGNPPVTGDSNSPHKEPVIHNFGVSLMSHRTSCSTRSQVASDSRNHNAHVMWRCSSIIFSPASLNSGVQRKTFQPLEISRQYRLTLKSIEERLGLRISKLDRFLRFSSITFFNVFNQSALSSAVL